MALFINGESMVSVKGNSVSTIPTITQLGLTDSPIVVTLISKYKDVNVDAWGNSETPTDVQQFLAEANIRMTLVDYNEAVLEECFNLSMASVQVFGTMPRTGSLMGGGGARFSAVNSYIGLNILSPVAGLPWRFWYTYLTGPPITFPLGTERSLITLNWRAIPYTNNPWGGGNAQPGTVAGTGSFGAVLFDRVLDT